MRKNITRFALCVGLAAAAMACAPLPTSTPSPAAGQSRDPSASAPAPFDLTHGTALLTSRVYPQMAKAADANANLFVSPLSLSQGLGLAYIGARGQTRQEIGQVLGWASDPSALVLGYNTQLMNTGDANITFSIANALWLAKGLPVRRDYIDLAGRSFGAGPETLDFVRAPERAADRINSWVSQQTKASIPTIVSPPALTPDTAAILTNALHLKARWTSPFRDTEQRRFRRGDGTSAPMTMMHQTGSYQYRESSDGQAIALPYGAQGRFVMELFLPRNLATLHRWETEMKAADFFAGEQGGRDLFDLSAVQPRPVRIVLPRFEARFEESLKPALVAAGMPTAFMRGRADFSGIAEGVPLSISDVAHATFLRVDEEGTEAAAATAVIIVATGARIEPKVPEMIVDRPFLAALRDRKSGAILFFGRIANPAELRPR